MSLDLSKIAAQIEGMASDLKADEESWKRNLTCALETLQLQSADLEVLKRKL
jgi:hypothetical protein